MTLNVVLVGMVVVFGALVLLILFIKLYSSIISRFSKTKNSSDINDNDNVPRKETVKNTGINSANSSPQGINPELIAAITAAVVAAMGGSGTGFRVRSIKRIGHTTPVWNVAGRNEYILTRL
ncbi:OadG family protein [Thermoclostridium stercorarium]|jgi:sodium pump decarboxylase gamma subunit|uniref:Oxaloacetate decarboxylase, gamma chain n=1 Tax=Thermoclostridium stercorarium subsp. leptospartum DSM 9219 TaxID=1346611 RepID=A0A1B1YIN2_THEST|nr:OadG family protein [Thermoclostridium stercorarium]ANX00613.1 oxaloacetate decarboxylase, gamma chain [Thermoclostridium stercorarium subsp. leptospartum DSM 9219]UZQ86224.1 OadG family protein [Thermoclostridium stercorarium]